MPGTCPPACRQRADVVGVVVRRGQRRETFVRGHGGDGPRDSRRSKKATALMSAKRNEKNPKNATVTEHSQQHTTHTSHENTLKHFFATQHTRSIINNNIQNYHNNIQKHDSEQKTKMMCKQMKLICKTKNELLFLFSKCVKHGISLFVFAF